GRSLQPVMVALKAWGDANITLASNQSAVLPERVDVPGMSLVAAHASGI
ncbi:transcriptional regulator, HxlR family, partial [mine drainage metagenome]